MREVIREYAGGIRTLVVVSALFAVIISGIAIYGRFRDVAYASSTDGMTYDSNSALNYVKKEVPQIKVVQVMETGKTYKVRKVFVDSKDNQALKSVRIMELWYMEETGGFTDCSNRYNSDDRTVSFEKAGTYKAKVGAVNSAGVHNTQWMYFITEDEK